MSEKMNKEVLEKRIEDLRYLMNKTQEQIDKREQNLTNSITRAEFVGRVNVKEINENGKQVNKQEDIYMVVEEASNEKEIYKWYREGSSEPIASQTITKDGVSPLFIADEKYNEYKEMFENHRELESGNNISLKRLEEAYKRIEENAQELGKNSEDVEVEVQTPEDEIDVIIKTLEKEENVKPLKDIKEEQNKGNRQEENVELSNQNVMRLNTIQKIDINKILVDSKTLDSILKLNEDPKLNEGSNSKFVYLAVVATKDLRKAGGKTQGNRGAFSFVAVRADGTAVDVNSKLRLNTYSQNNILINEDRTVADNEKADALVTSRFDIIGTNNTLSIAYNENVGQKPEVYFGGRTENTVDTVETRVETEDIYPIPKDIKDTQTEKKGSKNRGRMSEEAQMHEKAGCDEELQQEDVDGEYDTYSHVHLTDETKDEIVTMILEQNPDIEEVFTYEEVKQKLEKTVEKNNEDKKYEKLDELVEAITEEMAEDASNFRTKGR